MKTILSNLRRMAALWTAVLALAACTSESLDYEHPDVEVFVQQLKSGGLSIQASEEAGKVPKFTYEDIPHLLEYADRLDAVPSFPLAAVSYPAGGGLRLGECVLWTVETVRLGHPASMGCKMVRAEADNYEGVYFLTDEQLVDAAQRYRRWWEERQYPRTMWTIDPCRDEPLCGSGYMWW